MKLIICNLVYSFKNAYLSTFRNMFREFSVRTNSFPNYNICARISNLPWMTNLLKTRWNFVPAYVRPSMPSVSMAIKFATVFGTTTPKRPISILPSSLPAISTSKYATSVTVYVWNGIPRKAHRRASTNFSKQCVANVKQRTAFPNLFSFTCNTSWPYAQQGGGVMFGTANLCNHFGDWLLPF